MLERVPIEGGLPARERKVEPPGLVAEILFAPLSSANAVVIAVSGGPDSMAMMLLAADWLGSGAETSPRRPPVFIATVDHGLRPESRQEADQVAVWAESLGLPHRILLWDGDKPKTRIQERARDARYKLLSAYAAEVGANYLLTAHHADDQAETILFRLLRGSGLKGLAGMAIATVRGELTHLRPLLHWTKEELIGLCHARKQPFFDDPSNKNPAYARTRIRRLATTMADNGLDRAALLRLGARASRAETALQTHALTLFSGLQNLAGRAAFKADISSLRSESEEIFGRILELEIRAVSGKDAFLRLDRLENLASRLKDALSQQASFKATLGGVTLHLDQQAYLSIALEGPRRRGGKRS